MTYYDRYTSLFFGILGLYFAFEGWRLQLGTLQRPQAGLIIFCAGMILFGLSVILCLNALLNQKRDKAKSLWKGTHWHKGVKVMASLFLYALAFRTAGFLLSTLLLLLFLLKGIEPQRWPVAVVISVVTIAFCYLIFVILFEGQFPAGILGNIFS